MSGPSEFGRERFEAVTLTIGNVSVRYTWDSDAGAGRIEIVRGDESLSLLGDDVAGLLEILDVLYPLWERED
jgi:hypothetical protein